MSTMNAAPTVLRLPASRIRAATVALVAGMGLFGLGQIVHGPEVSPTRNLEEFVVAVSTTRLAVAHLALALAPTWAKAIVAAAITAAAAWLAATMWTVTRDARW